MEANITPRQRRRSVHVAYRSQPHLKRVRPLARRRRPLDLGSPPARSNCSAPVRRVATLTVELERMESGFALAGEALPVQIDLYQRTANSLRRLLEAIGIERRQRDVSPSLADIADEIAAEEEAAAQRDIDTERAAGI